MARESLTGLGIDRLSGPHWQHLRDVRCPGRPGQKVDHVLVGPSGIYVIGYQVPAGARVTLDVAAAHAGAAHAVGALLPERYRSRTRPVVCLPGDVPVAENVGGVMVASPSTLEHILRSSPVVLSTCEVSEVWQRLRPRLEPFPVAAAEATGRWTSRRRLMAWAVAATAVAAALVGAVGFGPELVDVLSAW